MDWLLIVLIVSIVGYYTFDRYLEHKEYMARKDDPKE